MRARHRLSIGSLAVVFAAASFAQSPRAVDRDGPAAAGISGEDGTDGPRSDARDRTRITVAAPVGSVSVGHGLVAGEPIHVRRTKVREGMTIVEISMTPFPPVELAGELPSGASATIRRPEEMPASW